MMTAPRTRDWVGNTDFAPDRRFLINKALDNADTRIMPLQNWNPGGEGAAPRGGLLPISRQGTIQPCPKRVEKRFGIY